MHDEPLAIFFAPDNRPAHGGHVVLAGLLYEVGCNRRRAPDVVTGSMYLGIVVDLAGAARESCQNLGHASPVFIPAVVLHRSDVKESVRTRGVILRCVGGVKG